MTISSTLEYIALLTIIPLTIAACLLLCVKYAKSTDAAHLAAYAGFLLFPALSLAGLAILKTGPYWGYLAFYVPGEIARVVVLPAIAFHLIGKKFRPGPLAPFIAFAILFLALLVPEQFGRSQLVAHVRLVMRFCLLWACCITVLVGIRRVGSRFLRIVIIAYCAYAFFMIPFVITGFVSRFFASPFASVDFFSYSADMYRYYQTLSSGHLLAAILLLARRKEGEPDLSLFGRDYLLSDRELEIVRLMLEGRSNPEIGEKLFISPHTVRNHSHNIFEKCNIKSRYELIALARSRGHVNTPGSPEN